MTKIGVQLCLWVLDQYSVWKVVWLNALHLYVLYDLVLLSVLFEVTCEATLQNEEMNTVF